MPEFEKKTIVKCLLQTVMDIISRRTSESYAAMAMNRVFSNLNDKYFFVKDIEIKNPQFNEIFEIISINSDFEDVRLEDISRFAVDLINNISNKIGKDAGYFFIKEVKEGIPTIYEEDFKKLGIDFDVLQLEFYTSRSTKYKNDIKNSEIMIHVIKAIYTVLEYGHGRDFAFSTVYEMMNRFSTKYDILEMIKVNDIRTVHDVELLSVPSEFDYVDSSRVGTVIQKIIQEINSYQNEKGNFSFIEKLESQIGNDYASKLTDMGVNLKTVELKQEPVVKMIIKSLLDVLSDVSSQSYAVLTFDTALKEVSKKYNSLNYIKVDNTRYSDGFGAVSISSEIDSASRSEVGKGIQKLIEKVTFSLGEVAGKNFIEKLKRRIGSAYLLKIEEMGVNLYMIELRQNILW